MLEGVTQKLGNSELQNQIHIYNNQGNTLNLAEKFDFIFAFYAFHEMKYTDRIINELQELLTQETKVFISNATPSWCHGFCQHENKVITVQPLSYHECKNTPAFTSFAAGHIAPPRL